MKESELEAILQEFVQDHLSPPKPEQESISSRYRQLKEFLGGRTFRNGSYARYTSTTPVNDLDVIYVLPEEVQKSIRVAEMKVDPAKLDIHRIVETLASELATFYGKTATVEAQTHSVGVYFGSKEDFSIDVVPAIPSSDGKFWVPEVSHLSVHKRRELYRTGALKPSPDWIKSDPKGYIEQAQELDSETGGRFRRAARIAKKWRWRCKKEDDAFALKSFHLELAVTRIHQAKPQSSCVEVVRETFGSLPNLIQSPQFPDRADASRFVDGYVTDLSDTEKRAFHKEHKAVQAFWSKIEQAGTEQEVRALLALLLGLAPKSGASSGATSVALPREAQKGLTPADGREAGEQFLEDFDIPINLRHEVRIDARVSQNGFRPFGLRGNRNPLLKKLDLDFFLTHCAVPEPFEVWWKIKNTGVEAAGKNALRGEIVRDRGKGKRHETTLYHGTHYVHCYIVKDGECVAVDHLDVPIGSGWSG